MKKKTATIRPMKNVTPIDRLCELASMMKAGRIRRLRLEHEGIELEVDPEAVFFDEAVSPHVKDPTELDDRELLFRSAGGIQEMPEVPSGLLEA